MNTKDFNYCFFDSAYWLTEDDVIVFWQGIVFKYKFLVVSFMDSVLVCFILWALESQIDPEKKVNLI